MHRHPLINLPLPVIEKWWDEAAQLPCLGVMLSSGSMVDQCGATRSTRRVSSSARQLLQHELSTLGFWCDTAREPHERQMHTSWLVPPNRPPDLTAAARHACADIIPTSSLSIAPSMNASSRPAFSNDIACPCLCSNSISSSVRKPLHKNRSTVNCTSLESWGTYFFKRFRSWGANLKFT